ncbi:hypothetical protein niasHT_038410 [Heterodera trifolii]|uniref:Uncharacterized protein n=1 Tax=Heterodera trifolii TaxID=157864 RepID=A0ABD2J2R4_9BILA
MLKCLIVRTTHSGLKRFFHVTAPAAHLAYRPFYNKHKKEAPESVQRIFSLDHGERSDFTMACKKEMTDRVRYDQIGQSFAAKQKVFAWATATILHWTALYEDLMQRRAPQRPWYRMRKRPKWLSAKFNTA